MLRTSTTTHWTLSICTTNVVTSKFDSVDEQNELIGRISLKNCDVVITMEGQGNDSALRTTRSDHN